MYNFCRRHGLIKIPWEEKALHGADPHCPPCRAGDPAGPGDVVEDIIGAVAACVAVESERKG